VTASRSLLPLFLATLYGLAIVYASLQPFASWMAPVAGAPYFLFAPWPPRWVRYDIVTNCAAYVPFGFFVGLVARRRAPSYVFAISIGVGAILSLTMETLQMFVPTRDASVADLLANTAGAALGGGLATVFARSPHATHSLASARDRWFLPGTAGDLGLALLAIWLAVQANPGIPLFATMYDSAARPFSQPASDDVAATLVECVHSAFQLLGVGLFVALLMRERRHVAGAVLLLIGGAAIVKGVAATVMLNPAVWEHWLTPAVALGVLVGSLVLALAIRLPRSAQVTLAAIALLSSLLATLFAPDLLFAHAPVRLFNGPYGHLLNFNGLTHTVLLLWPAVASAFLFALAGRPGWGKPD
jgi:VanZ family protein